MTRYILFTAVAAAVLCQAMLAQMLPRYKYAAQKNFIPAELGQVYLGMALTDLAAKIDLTQAEADARYGPVEVTVPFEKGPVATLMFKVHGISPDDAAKCLRPEMVTRKGEFGDYETEINRLDPSKATIGAFVYEISVRYKKDFDLRGLVQKKYGPTKDAYKKGDNGHFYDLQWSKKTTDGLTSLIRYHEETRTLQLCGIIKGTEWSVDS